MAQYWFGADDYAVGTTLRSLGFTLNTGGLGLDEVVQISGGPKAFKLSRGLGALTVLFQTEGAVADQEILLVSDFAGSLLPVSSNELMGFGAAMRSQAVGGGASNKNVYRAHAQASNGSGAVFVEEGEWDSVTTDNDPIGTWSSSLGTAGRMQMIGTAGKARVWQGTVGALDSAEPGTWDFEGTDATLTTGYPTIYQGVGALYYTGIGIGTDGDAAPFGTPPDPFVTTPTGLSVSNIGSTSADLDWT